MDAFLNRRRFLGHSAALGGSIFVCSIALDRSTNATPVRIEPPAVDEVTVREVTDGSHDIFLRGEKRPGLTVTRTGTPEAAQGKRRWRASGDSALHIEIPRKGRRPAVTCSILGLPRTFTRTTSKSSRLHVSEVDALIISHGHFDHVGGLMGFLDTQRPRMRDDLRLYTGGEDNFCQRFLSDGNLTPFGPPFDRRGCARLMVEPVLSEADYY